MATNLAPITATMLAPITAATITAITVAHITVALRYTEATAIRHKIGAMDTQPCIGATTAATPRVASPTKVRGSESPSDSEVSTGPEQPEA